MRIDLLCTNFYPQTGEVRAYTWPGCVFDISRNIAGKNEENTNTLSWSAAKRERIEL